MRDVPLEHADEKAHRREIAKRANGGLAIDGGYMAAPLRLKSYAVADVPDATMWEGALIYVPDEAGGAVVAVSNGTDWVRLTDLIVIS